MLENKRKNNGITLIAMIITIIILLILATIAIIELKNTNLFSKTIDARNKYKKSAEEENNILDDYSNKINDIAGGTEKNNAPKVTKISSTDGSKTIEISGNKVTMTENGTTYTTTIDTTIDPSVGDYEANTKNILSKIYGTAVEYKSDSDINKDIDSKTWRIFYIDFANKYKDGEGTVYLKADWTANDTTLSGQSSYTPSDADKTIIENMNKKWYTARGTATWNDNEHEAAWLCSPSQWTKYKDGSAKYAIGGPSTEMYCDSYNSVNHTTGNYKITCQYKTSSAPGYGYLVNGTEQNSGYWTNTDIVDYVDYNSMYCGHNSTSGSYYWWLASPSCYHQYWVCGSNARIRGLGLSSSDGLPGICPLISLPSSVQLSIK